MTARPRLLVNIDVPDLERALHFYTAAFDLRLGRRIPPATIELIGSDAPIYLLLAEEGSSPLRAAGPTRSYRRHWTPVHLDIVVDAIEPARRRALAAGALAEGEIIDAAYGRLARLADPFGHGICLLEFNELGYDALIRGR